MKLTKFLTGVAAAALLTGAANAQYSLVAADTDGATNAGDIEAPIFLAEELDFSDDAVEAELEFLLDQPTDGVWTTDDVRITVSLQNAQFASVIGAGAINPDGGATCFSGASISGGGAEDATSVTFLVSGLNDCDGAPVNPLTFEIPISILGTGDVRVTTNIVTDSGSTPVDGGTPANLPGDQDATLAPADEFIELVNAFDVDIAADTTLTLATLGSDPIFSALTDDTLGSIELICRDDAATDLSVATPFAPVDCSAIGAGNDVLGVDIDVVGNFNAFDDAGDVELGGDSLTLAADSLSGSIDDSDFTFGLATVGFGPEDFVVTPDGDESIAVSSYSATVTVDLADIFVDEAPFSDPFEPIGREGTSVTFPWLPSGSLLAGGAGGNHVIRIGSAASVDSRVFLDVTSSSNASFTPPTSPIEIGVLPAGGELVLDSASIEGFIGSDFQRGDIVVIIEQTEDNVTARRFALNADGDFTELGVGTVAEDLD